MIHKHLSAEGTDIGRLEGIGALNFLAVDDIAMSDEGEDIYPDSSITLPTKNGRPEFPNFERTATAPFLRQINRSGKSWVIILDETGLPNMVLHAIRFLRDALFSDRAVNPYNYCHRPIIIENDSVLFGTALARLRVYPESLFDDVIDDDLILLWSDK